MITPRSLASFTNGMLLLLYFKTILSKIIISFFEIKAITAKVSNIKNLFFLSPLVRVHFFKTFILPHFDYCFSLFIYMEASVRDRLITSFNTCIYLLFKINLKNLEIKEQMDLLQPFSILPLELRLFHRFCLFSYKIVNKQILKNFLESLLIKENNYNLRKNTQSIFNVATCTSNKGNRRLSIYLPKLFNLVLKESFNPKLKDFESSLISNLMI